MRRILTRDFLLTNTHALVLVVNDGDVIMLYGGKMLNDFFVFHHDVAWDAFTPTFM